jgi:predicted N-acyltransferase
MRAQFHNSIDEIERDEWNQLITDGNPFLKHEFHAALEHNDCVGERFGWLPCHLSLRQGSKLVGVSPLYSKTNSYGEFVFDHAWADAYQRNGLPYYPKLVSAMPYTPAYGERLLLAPDCDRSAVRQQLIDETLEFTKAQGFSSMHWLFTTEEEGASLRQTGMLERLGVQFHWRNGGYRDFDDFLSTLNSKRRKNIRRERRKAAETGVDIRVLHGSEVKDEEWQHFSRFYAKTFHERYSLATLNLGFFREIGVTLGDQVVLILAYQADECIAGALLYRSDSVLYGRHWGGVSHLDSLHFEVCYYQGIEYAIANGLEWFEPGAQGEHKIWRGFLPQLTRSYHWIADSQFSAGIDRFLMSERKAILDYQKMLQSSSPYRLSDQV